MARLKITIEGEMSPEEMKQYIAAAWGNLPRDIAVSEVDLEETAALAPAVVHAPPPAPEPAPVAAPEPMAVPVGVLSEGQIMDLAATGKLSSIIAAIQEHGVTDPQAIIAEVLRIRTAIPGLAKLSEQQLADRIPRVLEMAK